MSDNNGPLTVPETQRVTPPMAADERTMLTSWLDWHRATVLTKCAGLAPQLSSAAPLPTSPMMTVGGLVSHLRWEEHFWFEVTMLGAHSRSPATEQDPDAAFRVGDERPLAELLDEYESQCQRSREITAKLELGSSSRGDLGPLGRATLRWTLVHMLEETARHNGHLDLLRELTDGTTGV